MSPPQSPPHHPGTAIHDQAILSAVTSAAVRSSAGRINTKDRATPPGLTAITPAGLAQITHRLTATKAATAPNILLRRGRMTTVNALTGEQVGGYRTRSRLGRCYGPPASTGHAERSNLTHITPFRTPRVVGATRLDTGQIGGSVRGGSGQRS